MSKTEEAKGPQLPASPVSILPRLMSDAASELFYITIKASGSQIRKSFHSHTSGSQIHLVCACVCVCVCVSDDCVFRSKLKSELGHKWPHPYAPTIEVPRSIG